MTLVSISRTDISTMDEEEVEFCLKEGKIPRLVYATDNYDCDHTEMQKLSKYERARLMDRLEELRNQDPGDSCW